MKHSYHLGGLWRRVWLLILLALTASRAWAQTATTIYYTQGSSTATLDALASVAAAGGTGASLASGSANFSQPTDIVLDKANNYLYVADQYVSTGGIYRYKTDGTGRTLVVSGLAGTTYNGLAFDATTNKLYFSQAGAAAANAALKVVSLGGPLPATATSVATLPATFTRPGDLAFDATAGVLYVADQHVNGSIIKVIVGSGAVTTLVTGTANATYNGLALDAANGRLYFTQGGTDPTLDALKLLTLSSSAVTTLVSGSANFSQPTDLAFEPGAAGSAGQLYLTDQYVTTGPLLRYTLSVSGGVVSAGGRTALVAATTGAAYGGLALLLASPTATPVVTVPANGSLLNTRTPTYSGTAVASSTVTLYVDGTSIGTTSATAGGTFSLAQPTSLADGSHTVYATALASGSTVSANSATNSFTIDATPPSTTITSAPANPTNSTTASFSFTGSDGAGSGVAAYQASLDGGAFAAATSPRTYSGLAAGSHTFQVRAIDNAGNVGTPAAYTWVIDLTAPTAAISSAAGPSGSTTTTSPIPFTVTFSKSVTGFSAGGLAVSNGTVSGLSGSGTAYSFSVTPTTANAATTVSVVANAAQDAAGNGNAATSLFSITYIINPTTWTGTVSTDWYTAGNWSAGVPTATLDALIPAGAPRYPLLSAGTAPVRALTLNVGASLAQTGGTLDVNGDLTNNGTLTLTGGTVALGATAQTNGPNILGASLIRFWNLTIQPNGALLSTSAGASVQRMLTLNGTFSTQGNPFTLISGSSGDALVVNNGSGAVVGAATVQRYIDPSLNPGLGYRHYSAPVGNTTVADLTTAGFTPVVNPAYNTSATPGATVPYPTVYGYDQSRLALTNTSPLFDKGFFSPNALSDALAAGQGYAVNIGASELVDFMGTLNNGTLTLNLASNRGTYASDGGWQLVGNPYPAPLDYATVAAADRTGLDAALYVYSSTSQYNGQYRAYINGVGGNSVVPSGQGFFVRVSSGQTSGTLTFRNSQRLTTPSATTFQRTAETRPLVQLTLKGAAGIASDDAYVYFEQGATAGFDPQYDAVKLPNSNGLNISSLLSPDNLAINGLPLLGTAPRTVPLALGVPAAGSYSLSATQLLNLPTTAVYLRDLLTGAVTDLHQQASYSFGVSNASALITNRFELLFAPQQALATVPQLTAATVSVYPNPAHAQLTLLLPGVSGVAQARVALYNVLGQAVQQATVALPAAGAHATLDVHELPEGVYVLRIQAGDATITKSVLIN